MSPAVGRSLELYYIDGQPDGMVTAELLTQIAAPVGAMA